AQQRNSRLPVWDCWPCWPWRWRAPWRYCAGRLSSARNDGCRSVARTEPQINSRTTRAILRIEQCRVNQAANYRSSSRRLHAPDWSRRGGPRRTSALYEQCVGRRQLAAQQNQDARSNRKRGQYKTHVGKGNREQRRRTRCDEPDAQQKESQVFRADPFHWFTPSVPLPLRPPFSPARNSPASEAAKDLGQG